MPCSSAVLDYFRCKEVGDKYYLASDYGVECYDLQYVGVCGVRGRTPLSLTLCRVVQVEGASDPGHLRLLHLHHWVRESVSVPCRRIGKGREWYPVLLEF
jgi:hypothetical protein